MHAHSSTLLAAALVFTGAVSAQDKPPANATAIGAGEAVIVVDGVQHPVREGATHYTLKPVFHAKGSDPVIGVSYMPIEGQRQIEGIQVPKGTRYYYLELQFWPPIKPFPAPTPMPQQAGAQQGFVQRLQGLPSGQAKSDRKILCDESGACREIVCDENGICRPTGKVLGELKTVCDDAGVCRQVICDANGVCRPLREATSSTLRTVCGPDGICRQVICDEDGNCRTLGVEGTLKKVVQPDGSTRLVICDATGKCREVTCDANGVCTPVQRALQPAAPPANAPATQPAAAPRQQATPIAPAEPRTPYQQALLRARSEGKLLVLKFSASWCAPCRMLSRSFADSSVQSLLAQRFVFLEVDFDRHKALVSFYGVSAIPDLRIVNGEEQQLAKHAGYLDASALQAFLQRGAGR